LQRIAETAQKNPDGTDSNDNAGGSRRITITGEQ
jgi:hypothetical protein